MDTLCQIGRGFIDGHLELHPLYPAALVRAATVKTGLAMLTAASSSLSTTMGAVMAPTGMTVSNE